MVEATAVTVVLGRIVCVRRVFVLMCWPLHVDFVDSLPHVSMWHVPMWHVLVSVVKIVDNIDVQITTERCADICFNKKQGNTKVY